MTTKWLRLVEACRRAQRTQNVMYRLGVLGQIRTRVNAEGRLEFSAEDIDRVRRERPANAGEVPALAGGNR